jgi:hypothetical protein
MNAPAFHVIPSPRADALSFVEARAQGGFDYWCVENTGDYSADCEKGRALGEEYLAFIGQYPTNGNATLLQSIVDSMIARRREPSTSWGRYTTGIEIGFLSAVNGYALAMARLLTDSHTPLPAA